MWLKLRRRFWLWMFGYATKKLFKAHGFVYPTIDSLQDDCSTAPIKPEPMIGVLPFKEDVITAVYNGKTHDGFFNC